jgi:hypothetical protein
MTRRQRKAAGLPKPRTVGVSGGNGRGASAGKIIIPGGRYQQGVVGIRRAKDGGAGPDDDDDDDGNGDEDGPAGDDSNEGEWKRNGVGRVDVRGFRELKI